MRCEEMQELLSCYLDGVLDQKDVMEVEHHLKECPYCRQELSDLKAALSLVHGEGVIQPPQGFAAEVMKKIAEDVEGKDASRVWWSKMVEKLKFNSPWVRATALAAILLVGIGIGLEAKEWSSPSRLADRPSKEFAQSALPSGGEMQLNGSTPADAGRVKAKKTESVELQDKVAMDTAGLNKNNVANKKYLQRSAFGIPAPAAPATDQRKIIKNGSIQLEVTNIDKVVEGITAKAEGVGGYIESSGFSSEEADKNPDQPLSSSDLSGIRQGNIVIRIPVARFQELFTSLQGMGNVVYKNQSGQDVTGQFQDTQIRLRNLKVQEDRLLAILGKAEDVDEILRVENELRRIREEAELQEGELKRLANLTDLATLQVDLREVKSGTKLSSPAPKTVFEKATRSLIMNTNRLLEFLSDAFIFVAGALSYAVIILLLGYAVWYIKRLWKNRKKE